MRKLSDVEVEIVSGGGIAADAGGALGGAIGGAVDNMLHPQNPTFSQGGSELGRGIGGIVDTVGDAITTIGKDVVGVVGDFYNGINDIIKAARSSLFH